MTLLIAYAWNYGNPQPAAEDNLYYTFFALVFTVPGSVAVWSLYVFSQFRTFRDRLIVEGARASLQEAEEGVADVKSLDLTTLWSLTQRRLDYYHQIATTQAERSFRNAQTAMVVGFSVLLAAAFAATFADSIPAAIATSLVGASAAALGGYVSQTFIRTQEGSAAHLRAYFQQPLEFSKYLAAERLLEDLNADERAAATSAVALAIAGVRPSGNVDSAPSRGP
jgi:hypothetical protein